jgi:DNA-binding transcriptional LysR family regulator
MRSSLLAGLAIGQLFERHVHDDVRAGRLVRLLDDHAAPPRTVYALYTREKASSPKVRAFLEFFSDLLNDAGEHKAVKRKVR